MTILDPFCTVFFAIIVLFTTKDLTLNFINVLMEAAPENVNIDIIGDSLKKKFKEKIKRIYNINLWSLNNSKFCLSCKIVLNEENYHLRIEIFRYMKRVFKLENVTIQFQNLEEYQELETLNLL